MDIELTERTVRLLERIGDEAVKARLLALFRKQGALYGPPTEAVLERVRFAVIKLAMEGPARQEYAEQLYRIDTRDLLMAAGFGTSLRAHESWCEDVLGDGS